MKHICVIGNDRRMEYIAEYFYNLGYEISKSLYEIKDNSIVICKPVIDKTEEKDLCNKIKKMLVFIKYVCYDNRAVVWQ